MNEQQTQLTPYTPPTPPTPPAAPLTAFASEPAFEAAQRMAKALCSSNLVPTTFQGQQNLGSALIALEIAQRLGASPLMVMQNLNVIHGRPAWSSQFIIAALNSCGRFSSIRFDVTGGGDDRSCTAWAYDRQGGERLEGPAVTIAMAKKEGWHGKNGSKWQTMPELMLRYRSAAFFGRLYAPDILMGMQSVEEVVERASGGQAGAVAAALETVDLLPAGDAPEKAQAEKKPRKEKKTPEAAPKADDKPKSAVCDGNHGGPRCAAPLGFCWHDDAPEKAEQTPADKPAKAATTTSDDDDIFGF